MSYALSDFSLRLSIFSSVSASLHADIGTTVAEQILRRLFPIILSSETDQQQVNLKLSKLLSLNSSSVVNHLGNVAVTTLRDRWEPALCRDPHYFVSSCEIRETGGWSSVNVKLSLTDQTLRT